MGLAPTPAPLHTGGFCTAACYSGPPKQSANQIMEKRSTIIYLLDLSTTKPTVLELFQFHSNEYPPLYTTTLNPTPQQCVEQYFMKTCHGRPVKNIVLGKHFATGTLTGETMDLVNLVTKFYNISPAAQQTITDIILYYNRATQNPALSSNPAKYCPYDELIRFIADYSYHVNRHLCTKIVLNADCRINYSGNTYFTYNNNHNYYIARMGNDKASYAIPSVIINQLQSLNAITVVNAIKRVQAAGTYPKTFTM